MTICFIWLDVENSPDEKAWLDLREGFVLSPRTVNLNVEKKQTNRQQQHAFEIFDRNKRELKVSFENTDRPVV